MTTRRTHVVRCPLDDKAPEGDSIDIEVLDAISFRGPNGDELILKLPAAEAVPYIVDNTGGGHEKKPDDATRRSHMKRITNGQSKLDIEVLDIVAFRDANGQEWILDMNATNGDPSAFNTTDNSGDNKSTRRTHTEKIYNPFGKKGDQFLTIERCDMMAFRSIMGEELIIECPSNDDQGSTDKRADTTLWSPKGYDPTKDDPKPPINKDPHNYIKAVKGAKDFITGKEKISMGPLWWIRKINVGGGTIIITYEYNVTKNSPGQPSEPAATLTKMPFNAGATFQITGANGIYKQITDGGERIDIVNPLSAAMGGLYQWSYKPYIEKKNTNGNSNIIYYVGGEGIAVNNGNWDQTYPGATDQCGNRIVYSTVVSSFWNCNPVAVGEAVGHGFTQTTRYVERGSWDNEADAQYSADALNSLRFFRESGITATVGSITLTPSAGTNTVIRREVMGFNLGALKAKANTGTDEFTFEIDVPECPDGSWTLKGAAYTSKVKDFPLDSKNVPQTAGWPQDTATQNFGAATTVTVHINTADKDNPVLSFTQTSSGPPPVLG